MPGTKTLTIDNITGANITPLTNCCKIILYEALEAATDDLLLSLGGGSFVQRYRGQHIEIHNIHNVEFIAGVSIGTIKAANSGALPMCQEEY